MNKFAFRILILMYLVLCAWPLFAQVQLGVPLVKSQYFDANGHVLSGGCIFTYISGTNTPLATYTDFTGLIANTNPVVLSASGRPQHDIWLTGGSAYRVKLVTAGGVNCASGFTVWVEDGISVGFASLLASNNIWTGTNTWNSTSTFNGSVTFNTGFTSNGPSNLTAGGSFGGTFTGTPTLSGIWNFPNGITAGASTFSGPITSTVLTGTSPFVIASTTKVTNLNVDLLDGCDWAIPCPLGSTTPNTIAATTANIGTSLILNASTPQVGVQGTDTKLLSAGTVGAGAGRTLCTTLNGGATTAGCAAGGFSQIQAVKKVGGLCTNAAGSNNACTDVITWPASFADANYVAVCTGVDPNAFIGQSTTNEDPVLTISAYTLTTITVINQNNRGGQPSTYTEMHCIGIHP